MGGLRWVDDVLDALVVPGYTRVGFDVRRRLGSWHELDEQALAGRVVVVTGATSGLGRAGVDRLARLGASVVAVGRWAETAAAVAAELREAGPGDHSSVAADLGDLEAVRDAATRILDRYDRLDALVHNAGALSHQRVEAPDGTEMTIASQVVGPFLLTSLLLDRLGGAGLGRVITMSSGGMYTAELTVDGLQLAPDDYDGTKQYALAKRAQVTLNEMWAERVDRREVVFHAMHPGWADTPGVRESLPTFRRVVGPLLRSADAGADTMVWLVADDGPARTTSGLFWMDRRPRPIHRLARTRRSDTDERRRALWRWVSERAGVDV
jgi:NAD(P)-dependent dehydrogenase (short-subunit alcohol dehydrogenase family)